MRSKATIRTSIALLGYGIAIAAQADFPVHGEFIAGQDCPANLSIKRDANPGHVTLQSGQHYQAQALNKPDGDFVHLVVPGASPELRWVAKNCGQLAGDGPAAASASSHGEGPREYLLSISWQPAFCEIHQTKPECRQETPIRYDATHFTLHGLWPQPQSNEYCNVPPRQRALDQQKNWQALPPPQLAADTRRRLSEVMPGVESALDRHEWTRHGSCDGRDADTYFKTAVHLIDQVNQSALRDLVSSHIGQKVSRDDIRKTFAEAFGPGAGARIGVYCEGPLLSELRISIGRPDPDSRLQDLLVAGRAQPGECDGGLVDQVGTAH